MKREIKFRAWHELNKKMIYPYAKGFNNILSSGDILNNQENVMQFTGLLDKNGREIYEGDIVNPVTMNGTITRGVVDFNYGSFMVKQIGAEGLIDDLYRYDNCEVIGNIYENSDLLK